MAAKQAKMTQTDYTRGGRDISNTAIPLYQKNLTRMDDYLSDPMAAQNKYLETYYTDTPAQYDFLRDYNQQMAKLTANNYAATTGGYASQNQQNYDQQQRNANDAAARLWNAGVTSAYGMANQDYQNMLAGNKSYNQAYQLGKAYSDVEQYNDMVDQVNSNWWAPAVSTLGTTLSSVGLPTIGAPLMGVGNAFTVQAPASTGIRGYNADGSGLGQNVNDAAAIGLYNLFNLAGGTDKFKWLIRPNTQQASNPAGLRGV